ncbi:solute carrier organic anion transporter family member 2B1-like isoform X3 [Varroa jacobsoni]|nr:solute carrier organic anion transporter family member 2B1-like isoform X3 [Varroa destructor]XP_022653534.1 solute carrier organic anion transporter family member 2B1-like isoform X3 [Varroa destructor]XP_022653535.1 solute carrier organic anion transporter family member 2B1-like isoform X3 [Varroa destructor]XP_022653536.1 solute carrier organic anion transporter family member 2B1-like isoform X3 [Varroa destructor]XP_022653538.1 solute carrier organic anion transporter family member 2B1-l
MTGSNDAKIPVEDPGMEKHAPYTKTEKPEDFLCGVFSWRPEWLQQFMKPIYFTFVYLLFGIFQGAMKTGLNSSMTTLERKFGMSGTMISTVLIMDNITGTIASLVIGYYATKVSRPRILVFGVWLSIMACVFFVAPHIFYGSLDIESEGGVVLQNGKRHRGASRKTTQLFTEFCDAPDESGWPLNDATSTNAFNTSLGASTGGGINLNKANRLLARPRNQEVSVAIPVVVLLSIGNMLNGIGGVSFYIAGTTYMDDNVKKKNSPIYFAAIMALRMLGPLLGVTVNSYFLTLYEHPLSPPSGLSTRDPRWVGAWWLPFAVWGSVMSVVSLPLILFPKHMRRRAADIRRYPEQNQAATGCVNKPPPKSLTNKFKRDFEDFCLAVKRLSKNPVYMWKIIGYIFILNGLGGYMMNLPKYIEHQYRVSPAKASFLTGSTKVLAMIIAIMVGGIGIRALRPSARIVCSFAVFADIVYIIVLVIAIFLPCNGWKLSGTETAPDGSLSLITVCNVRCRCGNQFQPFCDVATSRSYFSPCLAACTGNNLTNMDCSCLEDQPIEDDSFWPRRRDAKLLLDPLRRFVSGFCPNDCSNLMVFIAVTTGAKFISTLPRVGSMLVSLRCVDPADKALAIGFTSFVLNILAAIPYPLIYGGIFDSACLLWGNRDGRRGNCWFYENDTLRRRFLGVTLFFYSVGAGAMAMMAYYAKEVGDICEDDDGDTDQIELKKSVDQQTHVQHPNGNDSKKIIPDKNSCASLGDAVEGIPWIDESDLAMKGTQPPVYNFAKK